MVAQAGRPPTEHAEEEKAQAIARLAKNEGNVAKTAKELSLTPYMLRKIRDANRELYKEACERIAAGIFDKTLVIADKYLGEIVRRSEDEEELKKAKTKDLMVTAAIAIDKLNVMTTVRGKFGNTQKAADDLSELTEEEMQDIIDAEYKEITEAEEPTSDEDLSGTPKDKFPSRPSGVSTIGTLLHRSGGKR